jgi:hypothetical protein
MTQKSNVGNTSEDGSKPKHKGEVKENPQKGAPGVSNKGKGKHFKDESGGEAIRATDPDNTTKKQQNSV